MEIGNIVKGHVNEWFGLGLDISGTRMKICRNCPIFSTKFGGLCNNRLWINPKTGLLSDKNDEDAVRGCGCRLLAKTTLPNESCPANKW